MKNNKYISILIVLAILLASISGTYAADDDKTVIELRAGISQVCVNGNYSNVTEPPYISDGTFMVPLEWFSETIGGEIAKISVGSERVIYGSNMAEITIGQTDYTKNYEEKTMPVAPTQKNNITMVPVDFISSIFPVNITNDIDRGTLKIVLEDDGALNDLSFLTGGISTPKIGNSYFGWSLSIPSGSRVISNSFKSDLIQITNEGRGLYLEIKVETKKGRTLSQYSNTFKLENSTEESNLNLKAKVPYFESLGISEYDEPTRTRIYDKGQYFYSLTIGCYDGSVSSKHLMSDKYYSDIISSFNLEYKGNVKGIQDLSKVVNGKVSYYNYISFSTRNKYLSWVMDVPANWNNLQIGSDQLTTFLGIDTKHYVQVAVNSLGEKTLGQYVENIKKGYDKNFSPKAYTFVSTGERSLAKTTAKNLKFKIKQGAKSYIIDEYYLQKGSFVYEISLKLPEKEYLKEKNEYLNTVDKISFFSENGDKLLDEINNFNASKEDDRVSLNDKLFNYVNKAYKWNLKIPGYWTDTSAFNTIQFSNPNSNAFIMIEAIPSTPESKNLPDKEKFFLSAIMSATGFKLTSKSTVSDKGTKVRNYIYRVEDEEQDLYGTAQIHVFEKGSYSYFFMSFMPELTATDKAVKEVNDIWKAFTITK
ncbi:stalk domain-containing protein [Ruminiclostridium cellulolyticum]|uniref:Copper amine oxidase domain protein n=1 Tax=Ruminiclostridium cellulolyticum (strain ATCC 35319 / DSM 5812 / JCM 6584 / H10) TaxID=394503 RepID=B8I3E2_RUMCH|nr:stalk domain-containing protein [Ruminiclostridium cellulolyticum]ACL76285.1 copper amine oxidase domain protein [Ruminiclostridium cellulolyticum H10]